MVSPLDYLPFVRELLDGKTVSEVKIRTAISRTYYAVYLYAAEKYVQAKGNNASIESACKNHTRFLNELKDESDGRLNTIGNQIHELKRFRERADYEIKAYLNKSDAEGCLNQAHKIIQNIKLILP
ncbi:HEPN domain protein [Candidatus Magnetobacterium bavaricum]|uniref:HEPN domain protein n=1 Tax=Candidatus Magnetobacterium bavaricum TaxID=29290 RepID=A0A0F3GRS6_9BACT|nr:HEPN domain protein [Candidatus Magnetobacterium bavaricum]